MAPALLRPYRRVLRHTDFRRLLGGFAVSQVGDWLYSVALVTYVYAHTHSATWVAATTLARQLPILLLGPFAGALADRVDRRRLLIRADLVQAALMAVLAVLAMVHGSVWLLLVVTALAMAVSAPYLPAVTAETPGLVVESDLAGANTLVGTVQNTAALLGPTIGAAMLVVAPASVAFVVNAGTFLVSAVAITRTRRLGHRPSPVEPAGAPVAPDEPTVPSGPAVPGGRAVPGGPAVPGGGTGSAQPAPPAGRLTGAWRSLLADTWEGARVVSHSRAARGLLTVMLAATVLWGVDTVVFVLLASRWLHAGAHGYGYLVAALGLGGVLAAVPGNLLASRPRVGTVVLVAAAAFAVPTALVALTHSMTAVLGVQLFRGAALSIVEIASITALQRCLPSRVLARVFGLYDSLYVLGIVVGAFVAGPVVHALGLHDALVVFGLVQPVLLVGLVPAIRVVDRVGADRVELLAARLAVLRPLDLLAGAGTVSLEQLAAAAREVNLSPDQVLMREGEPADDFYVVVDGALDVVATGERGTEPRWVNEVGPGGYVGEIGVLLHRPRSATVRARTDCRLLRISGEEFVEALAGGVTGGAVQGIAGRLARTHPGAAARAVVDLRTEERLST